MTTYLADGAHFQPTHRFVVETLLSWAKRRLAARRERRITGMHIAYLRTLDRHALDDAGIDIARLHDIRPSIVDINPVSAVICALAGSGNRPAADRDSF